MQYLEKVRTKKRGRPGWGRGGSSNNIETTRIHKHEALSIFIHKITLFGI